MKLDSDIHVTTHLWQIICREFPSGNTADVNEEGYAIQQSVWPRFAYNRSITSIHQFIRPIGRHILLAYREQYLMQIKLGGTIRFRIVRIARSASTLSSMLILTFDWAAYLR